MVSTNKKLAKEQDKAKAIQQKARMVNAFLSTYTPFLECLVIKKKFDANVPISFEEACQYPGCRKDFDRECNALIKKNTWTYVKLEPDMQPVLFTWVFKLKLCDAEGKKFIEKARCCVRGDRQLTYVDY